MSTSALGSFTENVYRFVFNWITRNCMAGVFIYSCWIAIINYNYWFSWHVILCTFGMIPLMTEAFMVFPSDELWSKQISRKEKYWVHGILLIVGTLLVSAGCIDTFYFISEGYHLYTVHGITGLIAMILFIVSLVLGLLTNYAQKLTKYGRPITFKFVHNTVGVLGFIIGVVSLCYGYYTKWFVYFTTSEARIFVTVATVLGSLWALNGALVSGFNQAKSLYGSGNILKFSKTFSKRTESDDIDERL